MLKTRNRGIKNTHNTFMYIPEIHVAVYIKEQLRRSASFSGVFTLFKFVHVYFVLGLKSTTTKLDVSAD